MRPWFWPRRLWIVAMVAAAVGIAVGLYFLWSQFRGEATPATVVSAGRRHVADTIATGVDAPAESVELIARRHAMVDKQLAGRDIVDPRVLQAMRTVPRHEFVPARLRDRAYGDRPLPIGHEQTISQPYMVAYMMQLARPEPESRVLDVGTGSGYQAAVLSQLASQVYGVEVIEALASAAQTRLARLGYANVEVVCGDGYTGLPEHAPFDVIIVAAAPDHIPPPLIDQLAPGGRLVVPVGRRRQSLRLLEKLPDGQLCEQTTVSVAFVPMTGLAAKAGRR